MVSICCQRRMKDRCTALFDARGRRQKLWDHTGAALHRDFPLSTLVKFVFAHSGCREPGSIPLRTRAPQAGRIVA